MKKQHQKVTWKEAMETVWWFRMIKWANSKIIREDKMDKMDKMEKIQTVMGVDIHKMIISKELKEIESEPEFCVNCGEIIKPRYFFVGEFPQN